MKFNEAYKRDMDNLTVSEMSVAKVRSFCQTEADSKSNFIRIKWMKTAVAAVCVLALLTALYVNRGVVKTYAESVFGSFVFQMGDKQLEMGDIQPIPIDVDAFKARKDVHTIKENKNNYSYWKLYKNPGDLEKETGIAMITSPLLEVRRTVHIGVVLSPNGYGHLNGDFKYGEYRVNIDGMFTYGDYKQDKAGYGYGLAYGHKYEFTYKASNGLEVFFVDNTFGMSMYLQAGNLLYQMHSNAPVSELKRLVESFEYEIN